MCKRSETEVNEENHRNTAEEGKNSAWTLWRLLSESYAWWISLGAPNTHKQLDVALCSYKSRPGCLEQRWEDTRARWTVYFNQQTPGSVRDPSSNNMVENLYKHMHRWTHKHTYTYTFKYHTYISTCMYIPHTHKYIHIHSKTARAYIIVYIPYAHAYQHTVHTICLHTNMYTNTHTNTPPTHTHWSDREI